MRATSTRRLLVFVVCAFVVGSLYLVPGVATSPGQLGVEPEQGSPVQDAGVRRGPTGGGGLTDSGQRTAIHLASDSGDSRDRTRPSPATQLSVDRITADTVTLHWAPTQDDVGVVGYHVWLNGYEVASTTESRATVEWFNDDTAEHVIQVRAVDAAGNESDASRSLLVSRPETSASSTTPSPSTEPSTGVSPDGQSNETSQPGDTE